MPPHHALESVYRIIRWAVIPAVCWAGIQYFQYVLDYPVPPKGRRASKPDNDKIRLYTQFFIIVQSGLHSLWSKPQPLVIIWYPNPAIRYIIHYN